MNLSHISELAQRQRDGGVVEQEAAVPSLAEGLPVFQDKTEPKGRSGKRKLTHQTPVGQLKAIRACVTCTLAACRWEVWTE